LITICIAAFTHQAGIKQFFKVFVFLSLLNSFFLIAEAVITKDRAFGLAGVMFVDYVGIAIVIVFIWFLMIKTENKFFLLPILIVLILASLFTQTRNSWISIFVLVFLITTFFYFSSKKYGLSRRFLLTIMLLIILSIVGIYASLKIITPSVSERAEQFTESNNNNEILNQKGQVTSSLVSRLFIWHTAYNAFSQNPITGIGIYAFPYVSWKYYTIPKLLFDNYVVGRTPHIAYLAIATETGVIGLIGYLIFVFSTIKFSYQSIKISKSYLENLLSISLFFCIIYITVSMLMTDAWLWNQGIVLWGIILGLGMANRKILLKKYSIKT
jgi:O-antigen ligase